MATVELAPEERTRESEEQRFLLRGVDWATYRTISKALSGHHVRLTYDRGNLELMTISSRHGRINGLLARLVCVLSEEVGLPICSCSDMTCDREDLDRGLEPDECFYLEKEPLIRDKEDIDLSVDPPPDLAVEVDISRSSRSRLGIYAALGIPEVWRCDGEKLEIYRKGADGSYHPVERSGHFPFLAAGDLAGFLSQRTQMDENSLVRLFRDWVRKLTAG